MTDEPPIPTDERRLRRDARACFDAALAAVEPERLTHAALARWLDDLPARVHVAAVGKAADGMMRAALVVLGDRVVRGLVVAPSAAREPKSPDIVRLTSSHPVPDASSVEAGRALLALAGGVRDGDGLLVLLSGGASSLATLPYDDVPLADLARTTDLLLRAGAPIGELNAVRKHLDRVKGGRLARSASGARVLGLAISDVIGDAPDVIASGPLSPDPTTFADALAVLTGRGLDDSVPATVRARLERGARGHEPESPKPGDACFDAVTLEVIAGNGTAVAAAAEHARALGYDVATLDAPVSGEASTTGRLLGVRASALAPGSALIGGGETVVTVRGSGLGGRCQELALAAALEMEGAEAVLLAGATDGVDGPTTAAGAIAAGSTLTRAAAAGLDPRRALEENDSHRFFAALDDLVVTGATGTNVADLMVLLA